jgi:prevent-host-death family protein
MLIVMTIILSMRKLSATQARQHLLELLDEVERDPSAVVQVTRRNEPIAALLSADRLDALLETLEILSDEAAMRQLARSRREMKAGKLIPVEKVLRELKID